MALLLAPMEGVVDFHMRDLLTRLGGFDLCVTEFIRVVDQKLPKRVFYRYCPELNNAGFTTSGTPTRIQLLGQNPEVLAENAVTAIQLGSHGIDLNFGCPAKTVNRNRGGAILLTEPDKIYAIVDAVRRALPTEVKVSAKIRLGYDDKSLALENARAIEAAGASALTVHARTKKEGYRPPAHWDWIAKIKHEVSIPVIANGEIWTLEDFIRCQSVSECQQFMLGRGALARPDLAKQIQQYKAAEPVTALSWEDVVKFVIDSTLILADTEQQKYVPMRTKQWLGYLKLGYGEANELFELIKRTKYTDELITLLENYYLNRLT